jgi:hypothetical protein
LESCLDLDLPDSRLKSTRAKKNERKEGDKRRGSAMNKKVDFDRETKTKTKGSLRAKLDSKVEQSEAKIQELKT